MRGATVSDVAHAMYTALRTGRQGCGPTGLGTMQSLAEAWSKARGWLPAKDNKMGIGGGGLYLVLWEEGGLAGGLVRSLRCCELWWLVSIYIGGQIVEDGARGLSEGAGQGGGRCIDGCSNRGDKDGVRGEGEQADVGKGEQARADGRTICCGGSGCISMVSIGGKGLCNLCSAAREGEGGARGRKAAEMGLAAASEIASCQYHNPIIAIRIS